MRNILIIVLFTLTVFGNNAYSQSEYQVKKDTLSTVALKALHAQIAQIEKQRIVDSIRKSELRLQLKLLKNANSEQKEEFLNQLKSIEENEKRRIADKQAHIDSLRNTVKGYPVLGAMNDTLFLIYSKIGASASKERALHTSEKIKKIYDDDFTHLDSIKVVKSDDSYDVVLGELILISISENDAMWYGKSMAELANTFKNATKNSIHRAREENSLSKLLLRISLVTLVIIVFLLILWAVRKGKKRLFQLLLTNKQKWLKDLSYNNYVFLTIKQELAIIHFIINVIGWVCYILLFYFTLPIVFSIFPVSRNWATTLINLILSPFKGVLNAVWNYLPDLFTLVVICFVMKYVILFVKYIFHEIEAEKLKIEGFHADWAQPTYSIIRFLLYAFTFCIIFPYLPGSSSQVFKGVSVLLGVLFSMGSSSAIANIVAGLVITYMRPFKIGDRIKIGDVTGDVIEKTLLISRIRSVKNEIITIPNSSILTGNTVNFSREANEEGLIIHTTVTIGYDAPWKSVHEALIEAAVRTKTILKHPVPFVLQTSLDDFYVSYQLNAYTKEANKQASVYSDLHQNIQDVFFERGIEILSPHYRAARDGNATTIPTEYLPKDYKAPGFHVNVEKEEK